MSPNFGEGLIAPKATSKPSSSHPGCPHSPFPIPRSGSSCPPSATAPQLAQVPQLLEAKHCGGCWSSSLSIPADKSALLSRKSETQGPGNTLHGVAGTADTEQPHQAPQSHFLQPISKYGELMGVAGASWHCVIALCSAQVGSFQDGVKDVGSKKPSEEPGGEFFP